VYLSCVKYSCEPGDALMFEPGKRFLTLHVVNNAGGWGAGFVLAISRLSPVPEAKYRAWSKMPGFGLGFVQPVTVSPEWCVLNMCAQNNYRTAKNPVPLDYAALQTCLVKAAHVACRFDIVQLPKIGCGLAGGDWEEVEPLIISAFLRFPGEVRVRYQD